MMTVMWIAPERRGARQWIVPGLVAAAGIGIAVTAASRGRLHEGLLALAVLAGYALHLGYRRGEGALVLSEAFGRGHRARAHLRAAAMTGDVLILAIVCAVVVQVLRGGSIGPFGWLAALAGGTYALSALVAGGGD